MIDQKLFNDLKATYPFISKLPEKLQDLIAGELSPDTNVIKAYSVRITGKKGCILLTENDLFAYWMSNFLFKKFPTYQSFNYSQVNELKNNDEKSLFIHASANPEVLNEDYEEGTFVFDSADQKTEVYELIASRSSRIN